MTRADFPAEPASTPKVNDSLQLRSLAPAYDPTRHGVYVDALVNAVARDDVRNIALTGPYGTGKSSILERLAAPEVLGKRVLQLSLSTVGKDESSDQTPADANPAAGTKTNLIQKEIVKQILYRDPPDRTPELAIPAHLSIQVEAGARGLVRRCNRADRHLVLVPGT